MLDKYYKLIQDKKNKDELFVESVLEVCNQNKSEEDYKNGSVLTAENFKFKYLINKEDFIKIKIIAHSVIKAFILQNKVEIIKKFKEKINLKIIIIID